MNRAYWSEAGGVRFRVIHDDGTPPRSCPYWLRREIFGVVTARVYGCGGYGEVTREHPAASTQITEDIEGPYICGVCHGTGIDYGHYSSSRHHQ